MSVIPMTIQFPSEVIGALHKLTTPGLTLRDHIVRAIKFYLVARALQAKGGVIMYKEDPDSDPEELQL